ncbi:MAG: phospho-sugar mutase [Oscillospiraceae bacterium]|nr:phospho-sugar mutase [Oscillospiraceae bacterium]
MNDVNKLYELWLEKTADNAEIQKELLSIKGNEEEILDRFYRNLEFGTAGLRGVLGAGTNRMNTYTVCQATQGLADCLNGKYDSASVAIGYDSRINSDVFSKQCAEVLAANGIKAYIFPRLMPTPLLSFAVMRLKCQSGIVITASHNPSKYNGYKCYDPAGYQMTDEAALETYSFIQKVDMFKDIKRIPFDEGVEKGLIEYISDDLVEEFYSLVLQRPINPEISRESDLKVIYSPLNGTGNIPVRTVLSRAGFKNVEVVPQQEMPDGTFPTCPYPNPEIKQVFECAIEMTKTDKADLLLATDPDCDRVGIAVLTGGEYVLLSGNDVGVLLAEYMLSARKEKGTLPENPLMTKSFVSTPLINLVAEKYGCKVVDVLTGFKYVGEFISKLEKKGEENRFVMGFEESYGYLIGTHARDKDAVAASLMICEMAAYYKSKGKTLVDVLNGIYDEFGNYVNKLYNFAFEGASGMVRMAEIMAQTRENPPKELAGLKVLKVHDFEASTVTDTETGAKTAIELPKSNVLAYSLPEGNFAIVRPSGTEPKIKVYITGCGKTRADAENRADLLGAAMKELIKIGE